MKTLNIQIPEGYGVDKENSNFDEGIVIFKKIEKKYPDHIHKTKHFRNYTMLGSTVNLSSSDRVSAFTALMELVELRDAWNDIDGGREFELGILRYNLNNLCGKIIPNESHSRYYVFQFHLESTRDLFMDTFKDLLETAKELI
jgi:hypothetical protein